MKTIKSIIKELLSAIYPNKCVCCGEIIDNNKQLCSDCDLNLERVDVNDFCTKCGLEKASCVCEYNVYRFDSLICSFKNQGFAQKIYYSYKFGKKQFYVDFLVDEMCKSIENFYKDNTFDYICSVPTFKKLGYDHSGYIAKEVSKRLNIPVASNLLKVVKRSKSQHKSTFKERMENVEGKYIYNYRIDGKNILLIDDIKTTGATIDECTRILLYAGADSVSCVVALSSETNKTKTKN
ncbi:MAG: double zinc ribbon domain-containing protein [Clostridia bacterium]|nr:double zinc ribbon domain-containing protein [Clostridia bacterium]